MNHIVFIGMPGSGKTTVGKKVAKALDRKWFDSDKVIESRMKIPIVKIFAQYGEKYFRELETACIAELFSGPAAVISLGGGAPIHNQKLIQDNATVVYLVRSLEKIRVTLAQDTTRPLLRDANAYEKLYRERRSIYEKLCQIKTDNNGTLAQTVNEVLDKLRCISEHQGHP